MITIGYFGDGPWASLAISHIVAQPDKFKIAFITPRFDTQDPELKKWADKLNIPFLPHANINASDFIEGIAQFNCDVLVSMSFNQILKKDIISAAPLGFINCHAGALPFYRGRNPLNWALINGETEFGVTVHYIDEGIDTGDIITQNMVPIAQNDTYADLLNKAHNACADTLIEALNDVADNNVNPIKQTNIHPVGFYCGSRRIGDENILLNQSSQDLHNFIRAISQPGPCARAIIDNHEIAILESRLITDAPVYKAKIGEIVGRTAQGIILKTADTTLLITKVAFIKENDHIEETFMPQWPIGKRLQEK